MNGTNMPMDQHHKMPMVDEKQMKMNMNMNHTGGMEMMMMQMYFVVSSKVTILFKQWHTTNAGEMFGSCFALFVIGVLYEGLKMYRQRMLLKPLKIQIPADSNYSDESGESSTKFIKSNEKLSWSRFSKEHLIQCLLHMIQVFVGYVLMLAFMTYNVWVCIAVILGAGFGYFIFGAQPVLLNSDHCN